MSWETLLSLVGILGGFELIKYLINYKSNKRMIHSQSMEAEFKILKDIIEFLETQLEDKTKQIRKLNQDLCDTYDKDVEQMREIGELKIQLEQYRSLLSTHQILPPTDTYIQSNQ